MVDECAAFGYTTVNKISLKRIKSEHVEFAS